MRNGEENTRKQNILDKVLKRKGNQMKHVRRVKGKYSLTTVIQGTVGGEKRRGEMRITVIDNISKKDYITKRKILREE